MTSLTQPSAFPLSWPTGWDRAKLRENSRFDDKRTRIQAVKRLDAELQRLGVPPGGFLLSSNASSLSEREPEDPGVALYFKRDREVTEFSHVLACDKYRRVVDNIWALALTVESIRQQERFGVTSADRALRAYRALPGPAPEPPPRPWHEVLRCFPEASEGEIKAAFQARATEQHTDAGGTGGDMAALVRARDEGLAARRGGGAP